MEVEGAFSSVGIEEHEGFMEGMGVFIRWQWVGVVVGDDFDDEKDEADEEATTDDGTDIPN